MRPVAHGATGHMRDGWTVAMTADEGEGGRIFFTSTGRSLVDEDEIVVLSVGVDIGSSTSHLVFSRIVLERLDSRYVVTTRETFYQSDILLTPYCAEDEIDAAALGAFIERQYRDANIDADEIDTGALILTGVAVRRRNARKIGELFARQAGKMVAVSAGDSLETVMAAHGSGAVARSIRDKATVMNVDVGGGTSKIALCSDGRVTDVIALDVGARLVCVDAVVHCGRRRSPGGHSCLLRHASSPCYAMERHRVDTAGHPANRRQWGDPDFGVLHLTRVLHRGRPWQHRWHVGREMERRRLADRPQS